MEIKNKIFQIESDIVKSYYKNDLNYKVVYNKDSQCDRSLCVIYFSSNEIYYPNTEMSFKNSIVKRDKYEWQNFKFPGAFKHIYIRDIQKQWYIDGINSEIDTPEKLWKLIEKETKGYKIYSIGSSAGGYAAIVYGSLIKAARVYAFNAQLNLFQTLKNSYPSVDPILYKYKNEDRAKFYNVDNFLNPGTEYFYFQSALSRIDIDQYELLENRNLFNTIKFQTSNHGFPFLRHNLNYVLSLSPVQLKELSNQMIHPFKFSVQIDGFFLTTYLVTQAVLKRFKKKLYDEKRNNNQL